MTTGATNEALSAVIYTRVRDWISENSEWRTLNPQSQIAQYAQCMTTKSKFVVIVAGFSQLPASVYRSLCATFKCDDCEMLANRHSGIVEISVPYKAVAPPTPDEIRRRRGLAGFFDDLTQPLPLLLLLLALLLVFFTLLVSWYVPAQDKQRVITSVISWFTSLVVHQQPIGGGPLSGKPETPPPSPM